MSKQKIRLDYLAKVARFLERGKVGHFEFNDVSNCAMGKLPLIFPGIWNLSSGWSPQLIKGKNDTRRDVMDFFGLSYNQVSHLFFSGNQTPRYYGGKHLSYMATKTEVARNIREFIKSRQALTK